ncbi:MAG TPA: hypothetical protein VGC97_03520 [Pyrinomonadaceae bacterium]|jgi:hypothetical protein
MERNLLEREISALFETADFRFALSRLPGMDAEVVMYFPGEFKGSLKEKSFLREADLKQTQKPGGKKIFIPANQTVSILGENGDWFLVEGRPSYEEKGIEFIYSVNNAPVDLQGWVKKSWVALNQSTRTIGFEFDVHYGFMNEILASEGLARPAPKTKITTHDNAVDGFKVTLDGPRFEIATKPFTVDNSGFKELTDTLKNIKVFTKELQEGCRTGTPQTVTGFSEQARVFRYPKMMPAVTGFPVIKLSVSKKFPSNCSVWASPQATVAIPLAKVAPLIQYIKNSEGKESGIALTGGSGQRMGLRSEALYKALFQVDKLRKSMLSKNPKLTLSNGKEITSAVFSEKMRGFLTLLASYLWTSELPYHFIDPNPRDYEPFAKAYLPINVKAPFPDIFDQLLNADEKLFFKEQFAKDKPTRVNLFRLVKPAAAEADGDNKLFPKGPRELGTDSVHRRQNAAFGSIPTWGDLIEHTINPAHKGWGSKLLVPLSNTIGLDKTGTNVALELRRVGFRAMFDSDWKRFMEHIFNLIKKL